MGAVLCDCGSYGEDPSDRQAFYKVKKEGENGLAAHFVMRHKSSVQLGSRDVIVASRV